MITKKQKGSILYFAVLLVGVLFSAGGAVTTILIQRIAMIEELSYSTSAFYAADAGIEKVLYRWGSVETGDPIDYTKTHGDDLSNSQSYVLREDVVNEGGTDMLVITATGDFKGVKRGIQVSRPLD